MRARAAAFIGIACLSVLVATVPSVSAWEVDETAIVTSIIDGDTFDCAPTGRIRLADIDAPESYEPGYREAADALSNLIAGETIYLDVDDVYGTDPYDRWVAVVYVRHNATHLRNVNEALVDAGVAVVSDYYNEFDPSTWPAYVFYPIDAPPPTVAVSADPMEGNAPLTVTFAATPSGGIPPYSYLWAFGDGGTSSLPHPSHTYAGGGTFVATITVTDAALRSGTASTSIRVIGSLVTTISATPDHGVVPLTVSFTASPSGGEPPYSFEWNLGDGETSSLRNPSHTYVSPGTYTVTVTVTDSSANSTSGNVVVTAAPPSSPPPTGGVLSQDAWPYTILAAAVGVAGAVVGLRAWGRRKVPPN